LKQHEIQVSENNVRNSRRIDPEHSAGISDGQTQTVTQRYRL